MRRLALFFLLFSSLYAGIEDHYKQIEERIQCHAPRGIDFVYLINLDKRPERLMNSLSQLAPYGIVPQRFSAIYGWSLTPDVLNDIALRFLPGMWRGREWVMHFPFHKHGEPDFVFLNDDSYGKAYFSGWTVKGTIGCSLSHLSVLKDAYDAGYETVWVLEDDFLIQKDPHLLSDLMEELDQLVWPDSWDVLYTDYDALVVDPNKPLAEQIPLMWRPDMPGLDISFLARHVPIGEKFVKIGSRMRAHSIIYRRSGLEKILNFYRKHQNFLPYDNELALIPGIKTYVVKDSIVTVHEVTTDTRYRYFSS